MSDEGDLYARVSFIPYLLALSLVVTWYAHHELFQGVDTWSLWTDYWGANRTQLEPRKWAKWTLGVLLFVGSFELFRRFDWFLRPAPGAPLPDSDKEGDAEDGAKTEEEDATRSEEQKAKEAERERVREERKRQRQEKKEERARKREEDKVRRQKQKEEDLRKRVRKAAEERARKVSEAAEEANREEDRQVELRHGKALGLEGKLTPDEIKKKYRQLMTQYHPDKVLGMGDEIREVAERKAKEINEAYDYFRKKYDL